MLLGDDAQIHLGAGDDLKIYHDGSNSYIDNDTGTLYLQTATNLSFMTNNSEDAIQCIANGAVSLYHDNTLQCQTSANGLAFPSGKGIDFNATSDNAGASSEILDDYEEGTCNPTQTNGSFNATNNDGRYTKVGRLVTWMISIQFDSTASGNQLRIGNLPFTSGSGRPGAAILRYSNDDEAYKISFHVDTGETTASAYYSSGGGTVGSNAVSQKRFDLTFVYEAA